MAKRAKKKLTQLEPRDVCKSAWYYVNKHSVDLIAEPAAPFSNSHTRLTRTMLKKMIAELAVK